MVFCDGSNTAFSCAIYVRWALEGRGFSVRLLAAKAKGTPKWATSMLRMELNGVQLSMRTTLAVVKALSEPPRGPERVWVAGDSETILACREKSGGFCLELNPNFRFITRKWTELQGRTSTELLGVVLLLELDVSSLGLPEPVLLGLSLPRCLDNVPLGLLLVLLQDLLGQALKERKLVNLCSLAI